MITVLINAYACAPNMGSEPGMAWNWIINLANHCRLHVITESEWRIQIEEAVKSLPQSKNITFYYNPVSERIRKMCWNQGDWRFYYHYRKWQKKTLLIASQIIREQSIDIIHQLNMIGFREPGYLWKIEDKPFIWGPIGGMFFYPTNYQTDINLKHRLFIKLKNILSWMQIKYDKRVKLAVQKAEILISSTPSEYDILNEYFKRDSIIIPETGCFINGDNNDTILCDDIFNIIWVGRFIYIKQLKIALKSISKIKHYKNIKLHIIGSGSNKEVEYFHQLAISLELQNIVIWYGAIPNSQVMKIMRNSQLLFFTSVAEATSTVVLEAISVNLPVVCFNTCGFGYVINESVGEKIELSNPEKSIEEFSQKISFLYMNRDILEQKSRNCKSYKLQFAWDSKAIQMTSLYKRAIVDFKRT